MREIDHYIHITTASTPVHTLHTYILPGTTTGTHHIHTHYYCRYTGTYQYTTPPLLLLLHVPYTSIVHYTYIHTTTTTHT